MGVVIIIVEEKKNTTSNENLTDVRQAACSLRKSCFDILLTLDLVTFANFLPRSLTHHLMFPWTAEQQASK